jgi:hypothetical protein
MTHWCQAIVEQAAAAIVFDGGKLYVDLSFGVIRGPDGAVAGAFAIGRDGAAA